MLSACGLDRRGFRGFTVTRGYCFWIGRRPGLAFRCRLGLVGGVGGDGEIEFPLKGCAYCPLVRGNRTRAVRPSDSPGSIPAWAGEPAYPLSMPRVVRVYPRVGGGTHSWTMVWALVKGLSPRGRGNPTRPNAACFRSGSIPAWAGEPRTDDTRKGSKTVYSRVGGGTQEGN